MNNIITLKATNIILKKASIAKADKEKHKLKEPVI